MASSFKNKPITTRSNADAHSVRATVRGRYAT